MLLVLEGVVVGWRGGAGVCPRMANSNPVPGPDAQRVLSGALRSHGLLVQEGRRGSRPAGCLSLVLLLLALALMLMLMLNVDTGGVDNDVCVCACVCVYRVLWARTSTCRGLACACARACARACACEGRGQPEGPGRRATGQPQVVGFGMRNNGRACCDDVGRVHESGDRGDINASRQHGAERRRRRWRRAAMARQRRSIRAGRRVIAMPARPAAQLAASQGAHSRIPVRSGDGAFAVDGRGRGGGWPLRPLSLARPKALLLLLPPALLPACPWQYLIWTARQQTLPRYITMTVLCLGMKHRVQCSAPAAPAAKAPRSVGQDPAGLEGSSQEPLLRCCGGTVAVPFWRCCMAAMEGGRGRRTRNSGGRALEAPVEGR